ncbi:unnamed protein product, partial [Ixodes pacificus]
LLRRAFSLPHSPWPPLPPFFASHGLAARRHSRSKPSWAFLFFFFIFWFLNFVPLLFIVAWFVPLPSLFLSSSPNPVAASLRCFFPLALLRDFLLSTAVRCCLLRRRLGQLCCGCDGVGKCVGSRFVCDRVFCQKYSRVCPPLCVCVCSV